MITKMYLEAFAPGMKARLDPAYRQVNEIQGWKKYHGTLKKEIRNSQNVFMSFANVRKVL